MNPLKFDALINLNLSNNDTPYIKRLKLKKNEVMKAPCEHYFHCSCLLEWMAIKMECPVDTISSL